MESDADINANSSIATHLDFLRSAERLKDALRSGYTVQGRTESVAEHSWQLTLLARTFADQLPGIDLLRLLQICVLHDLGEAVNGDVPAPEQGPAAPKSAKERDDFAFNLDHGKTCTDSIPLARTIRELPDHETRARADQVSPVIDRKQRR